MTVLKRTTIAIALSTMAILPVAAFAADGVLAPGKPAGIKEARLRPGPLAAVGLGVAVAGGVYLLSTSGKAGAPPPVVTTTP